MVKREAIGLFPASSTNPQEKLQKPHRHSVANRTIPLGPSVGSRLTFTSPITRDTEEYHYFAVAKTKGRMHSILAS